MSYVSCAQLRYTWAERRLDGRGAGFGIVVRSRDWPDALLGDAEVKRLLTDMSPDARREPPETALALVTHLRINGGALLVAKRSVGTDGAGRPGNYTIHALFDPAGIVGALDLSALVAGGTFVLEREVDIVPDGDAEPISVWAPPDWRAGNGPWGPQRMPAGSDPGPYGDQPVRYGEPDEFEELMVGLSQHLPADLVNQLQIDGPRDADAGRRPAKAAQPGQVDQLIERFQPAVELGAVDRDLWWERRSGNAADWQRELDEFVIMNQPVHRVPDERLWARWDGGTERGKALIAAELISRSGLADNATAVAEVRARPGLLDELMETGIRGGFPERAAAARWIAAAGDDDQVLDLAAELLHSDAGAEMPTPLLNRLQQRSPDDLPAAIVRMVAAQLDGALPLAPYWRARCLQLFVAGEPTCLHADQLVRASSENDLAAAVGDTVRDGASPADCWDRLRGLVPAQRLATVFAGAGPVTAEFLLRQDLPVRGRAAVEQSGPLWSLLAGTLGWAEWSPAVVNRLGQESQILRRQRTVLLILAGVLILAVVVLTTILLLR